MVKLRRHPLEKVEQAQTANLLVSIGSRVYTIGTRRPRGKNCPNCRVFVPEHQGTRQTPGLSDLLVFLPFRSVNGGSRRRVLFVESKAHGGRLSPDQRDFMALCGEADVAHVHGDYNAVVAWLVEHEYLRADRVPHYRLSDRNAEPVGTKQ